MTPVALPELPEPAAWLHRQGNFTELSSRQLDEDERSRGWTEEPLFTRAQLLAERAAERARCAAICVSHHDDHDDGWETCINVIAAAIRNQD